MSKRIVIWLSIILVGLVIGLAIRGCNTPLNPRLQFLGVFEPTPEVTVLVFVADWCPKCPSPAALTELQTDYPEAEVKVVNIDDDRAIAREYHVTRVPLFVICSPQGCEVTSSLITARQIIESRL